jgi:microcompartment protein CcmL/EutN
MKKESNIGVVEFKSIARGMITTDEMLKAADVRLVLATTLCPGKYLSIVEGALPAVQKSIDTADMIGGRHVFSSSAISAVNIEVIDAISGKVSDSYQDSVAIIESLQMANLILAADISVDSAEVEIAEFRLGRGCGVNCFYILAGSLVAVEESAKNAADFLKKRGALLAYRVIARPDGNLRRWLEPEICRC